MIVRSIDIKKKICTLTVESSDDLWKLRRFISKGDRVTTRTSRVVKKEDEFSRPDKGERIKVYITVSVEQVFLDSTLERLRVRGKVVEASDDSVSKSGYHTFSITPGSTVSIFKEKWRDTDTKLLQSESENRYLLIAIDRREAGIGLLSGSHLSIVATIESGASGKAFGEKDITDYLEDVAEKASRFDENTRIVIAGPGNTKNVLANLLMRKGRRALLVDGFDMSGSDGVRTLIKFAGFKAIASDTTAVKLQSLVEEAVKRISTGDGRVVISLERVREAAYLGAVETCIVSDNVFESTKDEQLIVDTLNTVEQRGGRVYVADTTLEYGKHVSSFGGIIALLRYPIKAYL